MFVDAHLSEVISAYIPKKLIIDTIFCNIS
jgi:hypothetical protein